MIRKQVQYVTVPVEDNRISTLYHEDEYSNSVTHTYPSKSNLTLNKASELLVPFDVNRSISR